MDIKYDDGMYVISLKDECLSIGVDNVIKCKELFLNQMSKQFDNAVNQKLGNYGFCVDRGE